VNELWNKYRDEIDRILEKYPQSQRRSAVMPLLLMAQRQEGYISQQAITDISSILDISRTEVASIVGFYTLFHLEPGGRYRIQVCTDISCAMRGADEFLAQLCDYLGIKPGETTPDGLFTIEEVMCLASCHSAPMFQVQANGKITYQEHQTLETAKTFIEGLRNLQPAEEMPGGEGTK
jgi:NADH-quinone oxidoreductase subunit E